ncbi:MAG TPA: hypothetical protein PK591_08390 [Ignavibacteriales bacterium]|nr:hypothetical protein [Ignavibacteriales bacterium]HRR18989.1 hypothetical protein [Ignavibacteriales bacterium]
MKHFISYLFVLIFILNAHLKAQEETLETKILDLTKTIEKKYPDKTKNYIGITKFFDEYGKENALCKYLAEEINNNLSVSKIFETVDRDLVLKEFDKKKFDYNNINNQQLLDKISQSLYPITNVFCENYLFGTIKDNDDIIKVTIKIVNVPTGNTTLNFTYNLKSDEKTDKFLGKPIRKKPKKVDTVVVVKEKIVVKEIPVVTSPSPLSTSEKQITQQKTEIKQPENNSTQNKSTFPITKKIDSFVFQFLDCYMDGGKIEIPLTLINEADTDEDIEIVMSSSTHFFSNNGKEYSYGYFEFSKNKHYNTFKKLMPSRIKFNGKIVFPNVKNNETGMQLLEIFVGDKKIQIRDIPINKK